MALVLLLPMVLMLLMRQLRGWVGWAGGRWWVLRCSLCGACSG